MKAKKKKPGRSRTNHLTAIKRRLDVIRREIQHVQTGLWNAEREQVAMGEIVMELRRALKEYKLNVNALLEEFKRAGECGMPNTTSLTEDGPLVFMAEITRDLSMTNRGVRKWQAMGKFPASDGNLNGRNFWRRSTYRAWQADVLAGKYRVISHLSRKKG